MSLLTHSCDSRRSATLRGFTLVESLVVMTITGIVIGGAVMSLASYRRGSDASHAASSLMLFVERAYARALSTQRELTVVIEPTVATILDEFGAPKERLGFKAPVAPVLKDKTSQEVHLYPSISASPATITLHAGGHACDVIISLRGRVRTQCD